MKELPILTQGPNRAIKAPSEEPSSNVLQFGLPVLPDGPADWHRFDVADRQFIYVAAGSQVYSIDGNVFDRLVADSSELDKIGCQQRTNRNPLDTMGIPQPRLVPIEPPRAASIRALSLAIAQKCNLGCTYCYADGGDFGAVPKSMPIETARAAVDRLLNSARPGDRVNLSFLGGEPLLARSVLRETTEYAALLAARRAISIGFAITTNATLLNDEDGDFFEQYGFAVTVSIDGIGETHDRQRPFKGGKGSFERVLANVRPLLSRNICIYARATITPMNMELRKTLDGLLAEGFRSVGFAPMLAAPMSRPGERGELGTPQLRELLAQMVDCGREFERQIIAGKSYGFANMVDAMGEIHRGANRAYPCGAANGYFGVSADGELAACHRFVGDPVGAMGTIAGGIDAERQEAWLQTRFVDRQEPCRSCWARYLCGGGCHHEVLRRGRPACEYIRGWLDYALQAYVHILKDRPDYFAAN
jgi:uncharacterized protein